MVKKLFLRLTMQCILASHKLYKKKGWEHEFLIFMLDLCTQLLQNTPRLQNPVRRPGEDNIIRLTEETTGQEREMHLTVTK